VFGRYYVAGTAWRSSDHLDVLHCLDMAYADAVVTERGLAATLREADRHVPGLAPPELRDLRWL
jgi:hypothetical protein